RSCATPPGSACSRCAPTRRRCGLPADRGNDDRAADDHYLGVPRQVGACTLSREGGLASFFASEHLFVVDPVERVLPLERRGNFVVTFRGAFVCLGFVHTHAVDALAQSFSVARGALRASWLARFGHTTASHSRGEADRPGRV